MKKTFFSIVAVVMVLLVTSCASSKKVAYFQNIDEVNLEASKGLYEARIMPKDLLTITVVLPSNPESSKPYNYVVPNSLASTSNISSGTGSLQTYLVDNDGTINFPEVGRIHVQGLSKKECEDKILGLISHAFQDKKPVVTVKMAGFRVTVTGEVGHPGVFPVTTEKISIIEALAQAGDLTIYGKRDNVAIIREDETGQKHYFRVNLNDANLINSPLYYLQQNDIVYVEPNGVRSKSSGIGASTTIWISFVSVAVTLTNLVLNLTRN
ncbi:MAG: polysaccharide biosynthesis/export family protein [Prevotella sp.]|nr:polysaccharide biosynthesis/export family protein [Prevotella sp.]